MADQQDIQNTTDNQNQEATDRVSEPVEQVEAEAVESAEPKAKINFGVGDKVIVNYKIVEGTKSRVQPYEGIVIGIKGSGVSRTFTVRRMGAANVGVERIFPLKSPNIDSVSVKAKGSVRRAKLYYLRGRTGKAASKIKEG